MWFEIPGTELVGHGVSQYYSLLTLFYNGQIFWWWWGVNVVPILLFDIIFFLVWFTLVVSRGQLDKEKKTPDS